MRKEEHIKYWRESAEHDIESSETIFSAGKYDWCLFIAHLVLEKTMKAIYFKNTELFPPRTHDLVRLANLAGIEIDDETSEFLDAVNTFNISARYPDEKMQFYKLCTYEFTTENFRRIKEIQKWLLKKIMPFRPPEN